ncbi:MAG: hypothetical protein AAB525_03425 [Patescibacteria group bacterium]
MRKEEKINREALLQKECPDLMNPFTVEARGDRKTEDVYYELLKSFNYSLQNHFSLVLNTKLEDAKDSKDNWSIITIGSDGRLEKAFKGYRLDSQRGGQAIVRFSSIELVILIKDQCVEIGQIKEVIQSLLKNKYYRKYFTPEYEIKDILDYNSLLQYQKTGDLYPSRVINSNLLAGNADFLRQAKKQIEQYMISKEDSEQCLDILRDRLQNDYLQVIFTGLNQYYKPPVPNFNLEKGIAYYGQIQGRKERGKSNAFKFGPLRFLQLALEISALHQVHKGRQNILIDMPANTDEQIHYLHDNGLLNLSATEVQKLSSIYKYFILLQHKSQYLSQFEDIGEIEFDRSEVAERLIELIELTDKGLIMSENQTILGGQKEQQLKEQLSALKKYL